MIEAQLQQWLTEDAAVAAIVSDRVYPVLGAPQGATMPLITYQRIATEQVDHLQGTTALANARVQFNCAARTYAASRQLAEAVRLALDTRKDADAGVEVVRLIADGDAPSAADDGSNRHYFVGQLEFRVWFTRNLPQHSA